jgi:hypothetical protein
MLILRASVGSTESSNSRLARVGRIDRSSQGCRCARRCDRPTHRRASLRASVSSDRSAPDPARSIDTILAYLNRSAAIGCRWTTCGDFHIAIPEQQRRCIPPSRGHPASRGSRAPWRGLPGHDQEEYHGGRERQPDDDQDALENEDAPQPGESLDQIRLVGHVRRGHAPDRPRGLE